MGHKKKTKKAKEKGSAAAAAAAAAGPAAAAPSALAPEPQPGPMPSPQHPGGPTLLQGPIGRRHRGEFEEKKKGEVDSTTELAPRARTWDDDDHAAIPMIPDLDEVNEDDLTHQVAPAPKAPVNRVATMTELNEELEKKPAFMTLDGLDLQLLALCLGDSRDVAEPDKLWDWDVVFTEVMSEVQEEEPDVVASIEPTPKSSITAVGTRPSMRRQRPLQGEQSTESQQQQPADGQQPQPQPQPGQQPQMTPEQQQQLMKEMVQQLPPKKQEMFLKMAPDQQKNILQQMYQQRMQQQQQPVQQQQTQEQKQTTYEQQMQAQMTEQHKELHRKQHLEKQKQEIQRRKPKK